MTRLLILLATVLGLSPSVGATPCGGPSAPCSTPLGVYHIALPDGVARPPAVVWLHGYGRSGGHEIGEEAFVEAFTARGYALVAPSGHVDPLQGEALDWAVEDGAPNPRDGAAFVAEVIEDAAERFGLDRSRILIAGHSRGGSMAWDLACRRPDLAAAYASVAGVLWEPLPAACEGAVDFHHTHGFGDRVLPFEGRRMSWFGTTFAPAGVMLSLERLVTAAGCDRQADAEAVSDALWRKAWSECAGGSVRLELWPGGHGIPSGWQGRVLDWFEAVASRGTR